MPPSKRQATGDWYQPALFASLMNEALCEPPTRPKLVDHSVNWVWRIYHEQDWAARMKMGWLYLLLTAKFNQHWIPRSAHIERFTLWYAGNRPHITMTVETIDGTQLRCTWRGSTVADTIQNMAGCLRSGNTNWQPVTHKRKSNK